MKTKYLLMGIISTLGNLFCCSACQSSDKGKSEFKSVEVGEFEEIITGGDPIVVDVRTSEEYAEGHIADAVNIDVLKDDFESRALSSLPQGKTIALYCRSGNRSKKAAGILSRNGYEVYELSSGYKGWTEAGRPVTREEVDIFTTRSGKVIKAYCIKHGSIRFNIAGKWLYVDPVGKGVQPETDYSLLPAADYILVTHEHADHLDKDALGALTKEGTRLVVNGRCHELLEGKGEVMSNGDELSLGDITVKAVPAYNTSADKLQFHPRHRDNGYVLTIDGFKIYIAGDTEDIEEMGQLKDIDVAYLPCNLPYTMTPEQLSHAARMFNPRVLFPYHYGTTDIVKTQELLKDTDIEVRIRQYQ